MRPSRRALVVLFAALTAATIGVAYLPGGLSVGRVDLPRLALAAVLFWFLDRGSRAAWFITVSITILAVLSLAFMGLDLGFESAAIVVLFVLQLFVLLLPGLRPQASAHREPRSAH